MNIAGIGLVFNSGRGIEDLTGALAQANKGIFPEDYHIKKEVFLDKNILNSMRRVDRFTKMANFAALDAFSDSQVELTPDDRSLGIILATSFGPHATTFKFLDDILDYGDKSVSPITFSHSVHNAAASYIALALNSKGPTLTLTSFYFAFHQALKLAQNWLNEDRVKFVLVGCVDEAAAVMEYICQEKLNIPADKKTAPFMFSQKPQAVPSEASVFFLLTNQYSFKRYCSLEKVTIGDFNLSKENPDICILDNDGMLPDETSYKGLAIGAKYVVNYSNLFGSSMSISGLHCVVGALMLNKQVSFGCNFEKNPYRINILSAKQDIQIDKISCVRLNCSGQKAVISLKK